MAQKIAKRTEIAAQAKRMESDLAAIRQIMRRPLEAEVSKGDVTIPQQAVMQAVINSRGINLKDLSREVSLAHSTVSGIVDRLQKRGMLERRPDPVDGRIARVYPTEAVDAFIRDRIPMLSQGPLEGALKRATDHERAAIAKSLNRLRELLEEN
ncbi:MAG: MarR family transcriptional regulator [Terracidiphilus sp.]